MEIQVQELIDKIKKDGIRTVTEEANRIRADAQSEASRLVESAKKEANDIISSSKLEAQRAEKAGIAAIEQASRNLILAFRDEIQALLNKIIGEAVGLNYNDDVLKQVLPELIKSWAAKGSDDLAVILPENDLSRLQGFFNERLAGELSKGIELKSNRKLANGFRISSKDGSVYYDFSAEAVTELLSTYLNQKLAGLLKESSKGI
ncbi:MAG: V-type ATP synthase subunit E [Treponema sp.]|nr:V-type ATP synthase subunit E [Treponema sp.]